jgi:hypothetical protein
MSDEPMLEEVQHFTVGQQLMIDWLDHMRNFTPYDAGVGKEAWDAGFEELKQRTQQFLALEQQDYFLPQVMSLALLADEWTEEQV